MLKYLYILFNLLFLTRFGFPSTEISLNLFSSIHNFKPNDGFENSATYRDNGKKKTTWDLTSSGYYLTLAYNIYDVAKPGIFIGKSNSSEEIDSFNSYSNTTYQISTMVYGLDLRLFPLRKYLFVRLGYLESTSKHQLSLEDNSKISLFNFKGTGYQAGFGIDVPFENGCFGYNCALQVEYLVRKSWARDIELTLSELVYDNSVKPSYREQMLGLGFYWFY
jgi:hypothetical protein